MPARKKRRKSARKSKKVTVKINADVLRNLKRAIEALARLAFVVDAAAEDPKLRRELTKKAGRGRRKRR